MCNYCKEMFMFHPIIFKSKNRCPGYGAVDINHTRHMIRWFHGE
jgi:hypothetical protein